MKKSIIIITIISALIPLIILIVGKIRISYISSKEISQLQKHVNLSEQRIYTEDMIHNLPSPVKLYFRNVLSPGQPIVKEVSLTHDGKFKTSLDANWISIKGNQYFTTQEPGFLWVGKTALFTARDMYIDSKGSIIVSLLHLFTVAHGSGPEYDQGELLRWLGEGVWFPTNLLPSPKLTWSAIDENSAILTYIHEGLTISYQVKFNEKGEIIELETQRHMGDEGLSTWRGKLSNYQTVNGMNVPMSIEAMWVIDNKEHSYAKFDVRHIEHH